MPEGVNDERAKHTLLRAAGKWWGEVRYINGAEVERIDVIKFVDNECKQDQLQLTELIFNSKITPTSSKNATPLGD